MNRPKGKFVVTIAALAATAVLASAQHHDSNQHQQQNQQQNQPRQYSQNNFLQKAPQVQIQRTPIYQRQSPPVYQRQSPPVYQRQSPPVYQRQSPPVYQRPITPVYQRPVITQAPNYQHDNFLQHHSYQPPQNNQPAQPAQPTWNSRTSSQHNQRNDPGSEINRERRREQQRPPILLQHGTPPPFNSEPPRFSRQSPPPSTPSGFTQRQTPRIPQDQIRREDRNRRDDSRFRNDRDRDDWRWSRNNNFNFDRCRFQAYRNNFVFGQVYISPFAYYYGVCPPFITTVNCSYRPPQYVYVDVPVYQDNYFAGIQDSGEQNYLDDPYLDESAPGLSNAIDELTSAFRDRNSEALQSLIDPDSKVDVYERGQYKYSMPSRDYLNLTTDAINNVQTTDFQIDDVHKVAPNTFSISAKQVYRDGNQSERTMYLSFVLEDRDGRWTLTQAGTAPDQYHDLTTPY